MSLQLLCAALQEDGMDTSEIITLIFSGVVTIATIFYVILTRSLVKETKLMRELQFSPSVNVFFSNGEVDPTLLYVHVINNGVGIAKNVSFQIKQDFDIPEDERFTLFGMGAFEKGLKYFHQGQEIKYIVGSMVNNNDVKSKSIVILEVSYENALNKQFQETIILDMAELEGISRVTPPDSHIGQISYNIKKIRDHITKNK
jgi:hypothetical protein